MLLRNLRSGGQTKVERTVRSIYAMQRSGIDWCAPAAEQLGYNYAYPAVGQPDCVPLWWFKVAEGMGSASARQNSDEVEAKLKGVSLPYVERRVFVCLTSNVTACMPRLH